MEILFLYRDYVISVLRYRYTYSTSQKGSTNKRRERTEHTFIISDMAHLFGDESLPCQHKFRSRGGQEASPGQARGATAWPRKATARSNRARRARMASTQRRQSKPRHASTRNGEHEARRVDFLHLTASAGLRSFLVILLNMIPPHTGAPHTRCLRCAQR